MNEWISVRDKLPEDYTTVFICAVFLNGNSVNGIGYHNEDGWSLEELSDSPDQDDVMFWMPLPADPMPKMRKSSQELREAHERWLKANREALRGGEVKDEG